MVRFFFTNGNGAIFTLFDTFASIKKNPIFKEIVKAFITPMISVLSIMTLVDEGSEFQVIALGISTIRVVVGMYVITSIVVGFKIHRHLKSRK